MQTRAISMLPWLAFGQPKMPYIKKAAKVYPDHVRPETRAAWNRMRAEHDGEYESRQVMRRATRPWKQRD